MEGEFALVDEAMEAEEAADAAASTSTGAGTLGVLGLAAGDPKAKSEGRLPSGWLYDEAVAMYVNRTTGETSKDRPYDKCVARPEHRCHSSPCLANPSCTPFGRCGTFGCAALNRRLEAAVEARDERSVLQVLKRLREAPFRSAAAGGRWPPLHAAARARRRHAPAWRLRLRGRLPCRRTARHPPGRWLRGRLPCRRTARHPPGRWLRGLHIYTHGQKSYGALRRR